jgi:hypothetical protein
MHDLARLGQEIEQEQAEPCVGKDPRCPCQDGDACHYKDCVDTKALPVPVAQPEQEPVAWYHDDFDTLELSRVQRVGWKPLYTTPPQRTWVGLTEEEKKKIATVAGCTDDDDGHIVTEIFRLAEANLKERNNDH